MKKFAQAVLTAVCAIVLCPERLAAQVSFDSILAGPRENWLTYAGDLRGTGLSSLTQITPENANRLTAAWTFHVPDASGLRTRPLVHDGVMYVTNTNAVYALDAATGRLIWKFLDTQSKVAKWANRGVAVLGDAVYFSSADVHLIALDRRTGGLLWRRAYGDHTKGVFASAAPLALRDRIIVGVAGGDTGLRGYVAALDARSGDELWRTYTVPARGEPGSETWGNYIEYGGGATWLSGTYDADTNTLFWTTGNPWPDFYDGDRKGDNLYTCSLLALDAATGKMKWHFQFTPGDVHDWDAQSWPVLVDLPIGGQKRKVVLHANRNGFLYVLDRATGEYVRSNRMLDRLDWATDIDKKGRPILVPDKSPTPNGNVTCPGVQGAANWMSQVFWPRTGWLYVPILEECGTYTSSSKKPEPNAGFSGGGAGTKPKDAGRFYLRAFDPATGERKWEYPMTGPGTMWAGVTGTDTGVLFFGDDDGHLVAADARTGKHLWHYQTGEAMNASPITYSVGGKQHVAIASSSAIFSFKLFEPQPAIRPLLSR